ncbi:membrane integrity-associated transporter subunit PqiC [Polymorphobacter sp. PAMC 29334]|uniref:ABC-type transport auxiliary lipoprotein family protein n=1 Tax=Polymorphobacter sp. PAMC 29334 TaxID=2862331 RepID=UPI001C77AF61|nr:ABC-type transport auxiliary lipoprotein family protein [Polymorphobacter sp. PAMC 29334]QYE34874.1 membrane integrity-associated transporter subunit PqiC [Polymorphobacter sp. PAMC 29334]
MRQISFAAAVVALGSLAACGPLVQIGGNAKAPVALMSLRATATPVAGATTSDRATTLLVQTPTVPGTLQTLRVPVATSDTEVAYLTGATWAEQPNREFQHVLADTIASRGVAVIDPHQATLAPGRTLSGTLFEFGLDVRNPSTPVVRVRYDATLSASAKTPFALRRFDAVQPVATQNPADVAIALNTAANAVAGQVADWVAR